MSRYTVYYVVRDWVTIDITAQDEETAKELALKKINKSGYKDKAIDICDGKTDYAGIVLNGVIDTLKLEEK